MKSINILGVRIDKVTLIESVQIIEEWLKEKKKRYVVTPNIEFLMAASDNERFRKILNDADLSIPDSARFNWALQELSERNLLKKFLVWPLFLFPRLPYINRFPVTTGADLMERLILESSEKGYRIGFLGGSSGLAESYTERLKAKYPKIKINFASSDIVINTDETQMNKPQGYSRNLEIPGLEILFVILGHIKQETWISENLDRYPVKVMIGVGGSLDYLSGKVKRAPKFIRNLGFEWLFRIIVQPWRIKRFGALIKFVFLVLFTSSKLDSKNKEVDH